MMKSSITDTMFSLYQRIKEMKKGSIDGLDDIISTIQNRNSAGVYLNDFILRRGISIDVVAGLPCMTKQNLWKITKGKVKQPRRNALLCLSRVLHMNYNETQELLKRAKHAPLNKRDKRDTCIYKCIIEDEDIADIDELLESHGYIGISSSISEDPVPAVHWDEGAGNYLNRFILGSGESMEIIARLACMTKPNLWKIVNGKVKRPKRNALLCLSRVLHMNWYQTQELLKLAGHAPLDKEDKRDVCIFWGVVHDDDISAIDDVLESKGYPGISPIA